MRYGSLHLVGAGLAIAILAGTAAGCSPQTPASSVTFVPANEQTPLTPIERGKIRDKSLAAATAGWAAWQRNDVQGMKPYWAQSYIDQYTKLYAKYNAEGKKRVRLFKMESFDVTELDPSGTEVIVDANFKDLSYYIDRSGKRTKPNGAEQAAQITLDLQPDGSWKIVRVFTPQFILD